MPEHLVQSILVRQITRGDFWNIERRANAGPQGGGGQTYIDIPLGGQLTPEKLWEFLGVARPRRRDEAAWPTKTIRAFVIGDPTQSGTLEFAPRGGNNHRYKISNQARQTPGSQRHPAWMSANGFPKAIDNLTDKNDVRFPDVSNLRIFIVKTVTGEYFAGYVNSDTIPPEWPNGVGLEPIFDPRTSAKILTFSKPVALPPLVARIFDAWAIKKNVLLYGPAGTGKTHAMQFLWDLLQNPQAARMLQSVALDPEHKESPFRVKQVDLPFATPARREWLTFHQNYSYENFILALRPLPSDQGFQFKPRLGILLDAAVSIDAAITQPDNLRFETAVLFIDEINRGNVSRIFGEFLTFMDEDYRVGASTSPLPVPLNSVRVIAAGKTEFVERPAGGEVELPVPWFFPKNVFIIASMNSVDRAVAPLDTALARRFARLEAAPDMKELASRLEILDPENLIKGLTPVAEPLAENGEDEANRVVVTPDGPNPTPAPGVREIAWLLLYKLNYELALMLGKDFEIGHAYLLGVASAATEAERLVALARAWDQAIWPQLQERFVNRPDELLRLLRMERGATLPDKFLFVHRQRPQGSNAPPGGRDVLDLVSLEEYVKEDQDSVFVTLKHLAGI